MKTIILDNVISKKELFYLYKQIIGCPQWRIDSQSDGEKFGFLKGAMLIVKRENTISENFVFNLWGQSLVFRIAKLLEEKNIGIPTNLERMWFVSTNHGKKTLHWLHKDGDDSNCKSILLFMTPVWQPDWRGSFYVDGEEFKYKPGSAVIFNSNEYHQGESPISETYNWQRITCNIMVN